MEYRIELLHFEGQERQNEYLVQKLNEFAAQGWRVVSIDLRPHPSFAAEGLPVLLERAKT